MCGIAGILGSLDARTRAALERMSNALRHRGPDDVGTWESAPGPDGRGAMLAFRRLAILDLSPAGHQPMVHPATGQVLIFNGEIYNYAALRAELHAAGEEVRSSGDSEVLLRVLARKAEDALPALRGMFALAFWDAPRRTLLLARDPLGIKPLYLAVSTDPSSGWSVAFASEVRALLASGLLGTPRLDPAAAASMAWNGFVVGPRTSVEGVRSLLPGEFQVLGTDGRLVRGGEFWRLPAPGSAPAITEEELAATLEECVRLHLASDVPLGVFLSGGVDSSAVANLAHRAGRGPVHTFTLGFEEKEFDEGEAARAIARAIGTEHREIVLREEAFAGELEPALESIDQPTFDGLNAYVLSRAIREAGFTVALVGTGGDELFGGYTSFRDLPTLHHWTRHLGAAPRALLARAALLGMAAMHRDRGPLPRQTRWAKLPAMVRRGEDLLALYQLAYALFLPEFQRELVADGAAPLLVDGLPPEARARLERELRGRSPLSAISVLEQRLFLGERLLRDNDAASMAVSIEQRLPLVDTVLLEAVVRLPDDPRYQPVRRKAVLRRIGLAGLDPALFERPKSGFVLPFERWIRQGLHGAVDRTLRDPQAVRDAGLDPAAVDRLWRGFQSGAPGLYWSRIWAVYVLVRWCQRHGVRR
ncbi:MAG TPA: asparagine synthase (glutamine-hydrolyzing) [Myxococcaceae bacterium]|nr:asparagine synthase (glutamine-hydrolyzing) [Myxococcaceae bacterium]